MVLKYNVLKSNILEVILDQKYFVTSISEVLVKIEEMNVEIKNIIINCTNLISIQDLGGEFLELETSLQKLGGNRIIFVGLAPDLKKLFDLIGYNILTSKSIDEALSFLEK